MTSTLQPEPGGVSHAPPAGGLAERIAFFGTMAALCLACWLATAALSTPMAAMGGMTMPGGWSMSMMWMRMPGQTWTSATAAFMQMWLVMMAGMMLPVLAPMLWQQHRRQAGRRGWPRAWLTVVTGGGYFAVWAAVGLGIWMAGLPLAGLTMQHAGLARLVPFLSGVIVLLAGLAQFTRRKARLLARCHAASCHAQVTTTAAAWRQGLVHGWHCNLCCANLTLVLLVCGMMNWGVMLTVTAAIVLERWSTHTAPARGIGVLLLGAGLWLVVQAALPASAHSSSMWSVLRTKDCTA
ncbi:putative metal-binding membrane protein [Silvimonas terrae]|uniref:Putative metal-binding membrane protein n=1 Tax=Silvimonas terrae TaxID=300266 RepID=A0A840RIY9_9NEIS|nr:DUF2182 domain-containing protein [Silvimonas terrae]MBB5192276.1 putative metal-binding membrane protein [Silvimonas terrae]